MPWGVAVGGLIGAAGGLLSAGEQSSATRDAANTQANAELQAAQLQAQQKQPWVDAGKQGLNMLTAGLAPGGQFSQKFSMADAQNMDAYKFALGQGTQAINNSNAAKSGTLNTNATQELSQFAEGTAAQFENQAYNQWLGQQQLQLGATESLAQTGQTAAMSSADATASLMAGAGATQAAGQVAQGGIWGNAISGTANSIQQQMMLSKLLGGNPNTMGSGTGQFGGPMNVGEFGGDPYASPGEFDSNMQFSDERLKSEKKHVGYTKSGLPIYTYKMGDDNIHMGVMAQDVEKQDPSAVRKHSTGFKMVDYSKVH